MRDTHHTPLTALCHPYFQEFDDAMAYCSEYALNKDLPEWQELKVEYSAWRSLPPEPARVPPCIHQIWFGGELPTHYRPFIEVMKRINPTLEHRLWTESNIDFELQTGDLIGRVENPGQKSDILRYEILDRFGGIYVDLDFVAVRSFEPLRNLDFFTGIVYHSTPSLANGLIGAVPGHPIIRECLARAESLQDPCDLLGIMHKTGPYLLTDVFAALHSGLDRCVALPNAYFYPYPNASRYKSRGDDYRSYIQPGTICVHLWHCSWLKSKRPKKSGWMEKFKALFHA